MASVPTLSPEARSLLGLADTDPQSARKQMGALPLDRQVGLVCSAPVAHRTKLLSLAPEPERLVPALPPAELCHVARAGGLAEAGWILEHATPDQIAACIDMDAWTGLDPDPARFGGWLVALSDAGEDTLLRGVHAVDMEQLVLHLKTRVGIELKESNDTFEPSPDSHTLDGQFYLVPHVPGDDLEDLMSTLRVLFQRDYWFYFRLLQAVNWELDTETAEWATRWRTGRLQDLGFPPWEEAMAVYGYLRPEQRNDLPPHETLPPAGEWPLPVWMPRLPDASESEHLLFRAIGSLPEAERRPYLFAFLALANKVVVADGLPLGDAGSLPKATEKAAQVASGGLAHLAEHHGVDPAEVLRRAPLERLFRVGFNLDDTLSPPTRVDG